MSSGDENYFRCKQFLNIGIAHSVTYLLGLQPQQDPGAQGFPDFQELLLVLWARSNQEDQMDLVVQSYPVVHHYQDIPVDQDYHPDQGVLEDLFDLDVHGVL